MNLFKNKVGRPSNETLRKRRIAKISIATIVFIVIFVSTYTLTNIRINKIKGDAYLDMPCGEGTSCYNSGFRDGNFYQAVVDRYNFGRSKNERVSYDDGISDDQLSTITFVDARNGNIYDVTGIEKLVNLNTIWLDNNNISHIDLSNNSSLTWLNISNNQLEELDLSSLNNLSTYTASYNNIEWVRFGNTENIRRIELAYNKLTNIDLSVFNSLESIYLSHNNLNEINLNDLNDTSELRYIYLGSNNLSNIDLSNVPNVTSLDLTDNRIQSIDLSNLHELSILELDYNFLESINLSNNPNLRTLRINNNNLSEVDFSNNPLLQDINLSNNDNIVINNLSSVSENLSGMRFDVDQYQNYNFNDFPNLNFTDTSFTVFLGEQIDITSAIKNHSIESIRYIRNNGVIDYSDGIIRTFNLGCDEIEITIENNIKMYFEVLVVNRLNVANYNIDNDNKYVFVGDDSDDEIIQAFQDSMSEDEKNNFINIYGKEYSYKVMNDKLVVYMYIDDSDILKYFSMNYRLGRIDINKARQKVQDAINDPTDEKIQEAQEAIDAQDKEETRSEKEELQNLLDGVKDSKIINQINHLLQEVRNEIIDNNLDDAQETLDQVSELVGRLIKDTNKELENNNIRALQEEIDSLNDESSKEDDAQSAVTKAERTKLQEDIEEAEELINKLKDGNKKSELTRRLTALKASLNDDQEILDEIEQRLAQVRNKIDNNKLDDAQELLNQVKNVIKTLEDEDNKNLVTNKISRLQAEINSLYERKTTLNKFDNAKTYDDIVKYFIIGGISVLLIGGVIIYTKKKK